MIFRMVYKSGQILLPFCYAFDRRTDGEIDRHLSRSQRWHSMQRGNNYIALPVFATYKRN